ncbi:MAG: HAMP domain-containing sensor histidine kinase [Caulobacterales bacterium]
MARLNGLVFLALAAALVGYIYFATAGQINASADKDATREFNEIAWLSGETRYDALNQAIIERAAATRDYLYLLADSQGRRISGNISVLPDDRMPTDERLRTSFTYYVGAGKERAREARGFVGRVSGDRVLLVARDMGDAPSVIARAVQSVWIVGALALLISLAAGVLASRAATRRVDEFNVTARSVMRGDLRRRAKVTGADDEFDTLAKAMNAMLDEIERLIQAMRHAGDAIAHDLRSPLTRLRSQLESALSDADKPETARAAIEDSITEADSLLKTFSAIMRLSRMEAVDPRAFVDVDITALAHQMAELYEPVFEDVGVRFSYAIAPGLRTRGDGALLAQALVNLLDNAVKYGATGPEADLRAYRNDASEIVLSIRDGGPGVPAPDRERVKERFVRLDQSRSQPGAGLGLSLAAAVAQRHQGRLELADGLRNGDQPGLQVQLVLPTLAPLKEKRAPVDTPKIVQPKPAQPQPEPTNHPAAE